MTTLAQKSEIRAKYLLAIKNNDLILPCKILPSQELSNHCDA